MKSRPKALQAIESAAFDVCVVGGGATGAGCALDAQLRGLNTVMLDGSDFASATSSASTKLLHGGVRYLQQAVNDLDAGQYRLVKSALHERRIAIDNAPFLAHPLELLIPCSNRMEVLYYRIGMKMYDWIAGAGNLFPSRYLSVEESLRRMPVLTRDRLVGTIAYPDGQFDDARYAVALVQSFTEAGGEAINHARLVAFEKSSAGKLMAAQVKDQLTGIHFTVRARAFVNATGPFSDSIRQLASPGVVPRIRPSKGVHILLPLAEKMTTALLIPNTADGRVIFAIPWLGRLLVGTTDTEANPADEMVVTPREAEFLLSGLNPYLAKPFTPGQIVSAFAGLRPLVGEAGGGETKKLIRDHEVELDPQSGLVSVLGGKWTTYRAMAEDGINHVQRYLGIPATPGATVRHLLSGSRRWRPDFWQELVTRYHVSPLTAQHLSGKYGANAVKVLELVSQDSRLGSPVVPGLAPIQAEVLYAIRSEMAMTIEDILARRIGLQFFGWRFAIQAAPVASSFLARELGWSQIQKQQAVAEYVGKMNRLLETIGLPPEQVDLRHAG